MRKHTPSIAIAVLFVVGCVSSSIAQQPSLGALAKKAAAEKAAKTDADTKNGTTRPISKVYTNRDAPGPLVAGTSAATVTAPESPSPEGALDETYWRGRMLVLLEKHASDVHASEAVSARHNDLMALLRRVGPFGMNSVGPELLRVQTDLVRWTAVLRDNNAAIAALKEEGRRAGALPGWFR